MKLNKTSLLQYGDFIFADTSEDIEGSGNFTLLCSDEITFAGYHTIIARAMHDIHFRYIAYWFDSIGNRTQIRNRVSGVKVFSITQSIIKNTKLIQPPLPEQQKIANYLDKKCTTIDTILSEKEKAIKTMQSYKKSLIYDYVTGKKRV